MVFWDSVLLFLEFWKSIRKFSDTPLKYSVWIKATEVNYKSDVCYLCSTFVNNCSFLKHLDNLACSLHTHGRLLPFTEDAREKA